MVRAFTSSRVYAKESAEIYPELSIIANFSSLSGRNPVTTIRSTALKLVRSFGRTGWILARVWSPFVCTGYDKERFLY